MSQRVLAMVAVLSMTPCFAVAQEGVSRAVPAARPDQQTPDIQPTPSPPSIPSAQVRALKVQPFVLKSVEVHGSTLSPQVLAAAYGSFVGHETGSNEIQGITDVIAHTYEGSDIALYTIIVPQQDLSTGQLRVDVLEGHIGKVELNTAAAGRAAFLIDADTARLKADQPLRRSTLQREISVIRDIPGLRSQMDLLNGDQPDAVTLRVDAQFEPVQVAFSVNNRGTAFLGTTQAQADLIFNSLVRSGDQTKLTYAAPTQDDLFRFVALSHTTPVGTDGAALALNLSYLQTKPATTALEGHADSFGLQYSQPLIRSYDQDLIVTFGLDGVNAKNALFGSVFSDDDSRAARASVSYTRKRADSVAFAVASVSFGIDGLGANTKTPAYTDLSFTKYNLRLGYNRALTSSVVLRLKAAGQMTDDRLPSAEQFALGGAEYGRGYESAILAGDRGYGASAEIALQPKQMPKILHGTEVYAFVDGGEVTFLARDALPQQTLPLASTGAGVRLNFPSRFIVELEAAQGLPNRYAFLDHRGLHGIVTLRSLF